MKRTILSLLLGVSFLFSSESEQMFWDEVKDTNDIELLKLYKKRYPNGIFESLADIKIKRLQSGNISDTTIINTIPDWIKGHTSKYRFYGVGKANKHFKGEDYQRSLATKRAQRKLEDKFDDFNLTSRQITEYSRYIETEVYKDKREKLYILLYIDDENID